MTGWMKAVAVLVLLAAFIGLGLGTLHALEGFHGRVLAEGDAIGAGRVTILRQQDAIKYGKALADGIQAARVDERRMAAAVVQGEVDARKKAQAEALVLRRDHELAVIGGRGLRDDLDSLNAASAAAGIPSAASCPGELVRERAASVRARNMLGTCNAAFTDLAGRVDESWNAVTLKLDTALGYVRAVAPQLSPP